MVGGFFLFLPGFLTRNSSIICVKNGISLIAYNKGIQTKTFFNSYKKSKLEIGASFLIENISR